MKLEKLETTQNVQTAVSKGDAGKKLHDALEKVKNLESKIAGQDRKEKKYRQELASLMSSNAEWETKTKKLFIEVQQKEIMQEKKEYEKKVRMQEMATVMKD